MASLSMASDPVEKPSKSLAISTATLAAPSIKITRCTERSRVSVFGVDLLYVFVNALELPSS